MAKILIVDGGVPFHGVGGTLNHSYAELAQKTLSAMGHEATITRVDAQWKAAEEADKFKAADAVILTFAAWWMGTPWQVKQYIDEVFCAGLSVGGDGRPVPIPRTTTAAAACSPTRSTCFPSPGMRL